MSVQTCEINTLRYDVEKCVGCGMCAIVCPHAVFTIVERRSQLARPEACIECGACARNCPTEAIAVDDGPGCFVALLHAAIFGGEPTCGPREDGQEGCCGEDASCC